jgi:hypothetical protein
MFMIDCCGALASKRCTLSITQPPRRPAHTHASCYELTAVTAVVASQSVLSATVYSCSSSALIRPAVLKRFKMVKNCARDTSAPIAASAAV